MTQEKDKHLIRNMKNVPYDVYPKKAHVRASSSEKVPSSNAQNMRIYIILHSHSLIRAFALH